MDPVRLASFIRGIADYIDYYQNPSRKAVNAKLRFVLSSLGVATSDPFLRRYYKDIAKSGIKALSEKMNPDILSDIDEKIRVIKRGGIPKDPLEEVIGPIPGPTKKPLDDKQKEKEIKRLENLKYNFTNDVPQTVDDIYVEYVSKIMAADAAMAPAPTEFSESDSDRLGLGMAEIKTPYVPGSRGQHYVPLSIEKRKSYFEAFLDGVRKHEEYQTVLENVRDTDPETAVTIEKQLSNPWLSSFINKLYVKSLNLFFNTLIDLIPTDLKDSIVTFSYSDSKFTGSAKDSFIIMVDHLVRNPLQFSNRNDFLKEFLSLVVKTQNNPKVAEYVESNSKDVFKLWVNEVEECQEYKNLVDRYVNVEVR